MLHLLYILAFTCLAFLTVGNLIRSLIAFSSESNRSNQGYANRYGQSNGFGSTAHPELFDESGNAIREPLMVVRSMTVDDARERLDALYNASPSYRGEESEEA